MKNIHSKLLCLLSLTMTPYALNGMFINAVRRTIPSVRYNSTQNPTITKTVKVKISPTLPQTFLQKLLGTTTPNPEYYTLLKEHIAKKEEQKRRLLEKKESLQKQLEQIEFIADIIPLEKLEAAASQRYVETRSPLAKKDWLRISIATDILIHQARCCRVKLGLPIPEYKESKLDDKNEKAFYPSRYLVDKEKLLSPENQELLNLKEKIIADLRNLHSNLE